jgi:serine/threonine protein kinase
LNFQLGPIASSPVSDTDDFGPIPLLPEIPSYITFSDVEYVAEGTHAVIYKVLATGKEQHTRCLKLFRENWDTPYILESTAYAYLNRSGVEKFIPKVYGCGLRPLSGWGLHSITGEEESLHHAIVMEWIEDAEMLSEKNITVDLTVNFIHGLIHIHDAGVLHSDTFAQNMLVVPSKKRSVWIDFSCAKIGAELYYDQEIGGVASLSMGMLVNRT